MDISGTTLDGDNQLPVFVAVIDDEVDLAYLFKDALSEIDGLMGFNFSDPSLALEHFLNDIEEFISALFQKKGYKRIQRTLVTILFCLQIKSLARVFSIRSKQIPN